MEEGKVDIDGKPRRKMTDKERGRENDSNISIRKLLVLWVVVVVLRGENKNHPVLSHRIGMISLFILMPPAEEARPKKNRKVTHSTVEKKRKMLNQPSAEPFQRLMPAIFPPD